MQKLLWNENNWLICDCKKPQATIIAILIFFKFCSGSDVFLCAISFCKLDFVDAMQSKILQPTNSDLMHVARALFCFYISKL